MLKTKIFLILFCPSVALASYSGYTYQRVITISSTNVSNVFGTLSNFPVLVSTNNVAFSTTTASGGRLNASGMDLIFSTMSDCSYKLFWDTDTVQNVGVSTMNVWVNIPLLTTATLTSATFYVCYGNDRILTYQGNSTSAWDSNFKAVWHLPDGSSLTTNDSTVNNSSGTNHSATAVSGTVDGAATFVAASSQYIDITSLIANTIFLDTTFNLSFWIKTTSAIFQMPMSKGGLLAGSGLVVFMNSPANKLTFDIKTGSGSNALLRDTSSNINNGAWHYLSANITTNSSGTSGQNTTIYMDGITDQGTLTNSFASAFPANSFKIGRRDTPTYFDGSLDEVRISAVSRSSDWIKTEYNNQNAPTTFVTIGAETTVANYAPVNNGTSISGGKTQFQGTGVQVK